MQGWIRFMRLERGWRLELEWTRGPRAKVPRPRTEPKPALPRDPPRTGTCAPGRGGVQLGLCANPR